ncbi:MAG: hypothetical protein HZB91_14190 [Elusimicrobia bacterium]|nr:hypothetical protein [Elusimicrobiota bacterium]
MAEPWTRRLALILGLPAAAFAVLLLIQFGRGFVSGLRKAPDAPAGATTSQLPAASGSARTVRLLADLELTLPAGYDFMPMPDNPSTWVFFQTGSPPTDPDALTLQTTDLPAAEPATEAVLQDYQQTLEAGFKQDGREPDAVRISGRFLNGFAVNLHNPAQSQIYLISSRRIYKFSSGNDFSRQMQAVSASLHETQAGQATK